MSITPYRGIDVNSNLVAVIDTETTGIYPTSHDRIIEIAILLVNASGDLVDRYETLLNPNRDLGPTHIHGIRAEEVLFAPTFADIAGDLVLFLSRARLIAGHNVTFDIRFVEAELARLGIDPRWRPPVVDTYRLTQLPLEAACEQYGVVTDERYHSALGDVMATAGLLFALVTEGDLDILSRFGRIDLPDIEPRQTATLTRGEAAVRASHGSGFLSTLAEQVVYAVKATDVVKLDYFRLLGRALEDGLLEEHESAYLRAFAEDHQQSPAQIRQLHVEFLTGMVVLAWSDGVLTDHELNDLKRVCRLLDLNTHELDTILAEVTAKTVDDQPQDVNAVENLASMTVCFTGAIMSTVQGEVITRTYAKRLAEEAGLISKTSVSKGLDLLVIADPDSMSGKAKKAREYGVRIIAEREFWGLIGVAVN